MVIAELGVGWGVGCGVCASPQLTFDVEAVVRAVGPHACFLSIAWYWVSGDRGKGQWPRGQENRGLQYGLTRVPDDLSSMEQGMPVGHSHWHCGRLCLAEEVGLLVRKGAFSLNLKAGLLVYFLWICELSGERPCVFSLWSLQYLP